MKFAIVICLAILISLVAPTCLETDLITNRDGTEEQCDQLAKDNDWDTYAFIEDTPHNHCLVYDKKELKSNDCNSCVNMFVQGCFWCESQDFCDEHEPS